MCTNQFARKFCVGKIIFENIPKALLLHMNLMLTKTVKTQMFLDTVLLLFHVVEEKGAQ